MPQGFAIIVIGASAGGVDVLRGIVATMPPDVNAAIFIVLHIGAHHSDLPRLLERSGDLPVVHASDGDAIARGRIYVAPPDHHMILGNDRIVLTRGPREIWARPAINPLFRSAAHGYGRNVIGVVLTGGLNDGTAGLLAIKAAKGTTIVQDPADCQTPSMPQSAIANVEIDHVVPAAAIGDLLVRIAGERRERPVAVTSPERRIGDAQACRCAADDPGKPPVAAAGSRPSAAPLH